MNTPKIIVSTFAGVGKDYAIEHLKNKYKIDVIDKDENFYKKYPAPEDYHADIDKRIKKCDILFIPYFLNMEKRYMQKCVDYFLIYPDKSCKKEYIKRFVDLGFTADQIKNLSDNWDAMISDCNNYVKHTTNRAIKLKSGEYCLSYIEQIMSDSSVDNISSPEQLLSWMKTHANYTHDVPRGEFRANSKINRLSGKDVYSRWTGTCETFSYFEYEVLSKLGYDCTLYRYHESDKPYGELGQTHVICTYKNNKNIMYFEYANYKLKGIHKFNTRDELFDFIVKTWDIADNKSKYLLVRKIPNDCDAGMNGYDGAKKCAKYPIIKILDLHDTLQEGITGSTDLKDDGTLLVNTNAQNVPTKGKESKITLNSDSRKTEITVSDKNKDGDVNVGVKTSVDTDVEYSKNINYYNNKLQSDIMNARKAGVPSNLTEVIKNAVTYLSKCHIGAFLTFEKNQSLSKFYEENGIKIDCPVSSDIFTSIFYPGTETHDGAVIIKDGIIKYANVFYKNINDKKQNNKYGARHRAAIGISEETDAISIIVSEETGHISFAINGELHQVKPEQFNEYFNKYINTSYKKTNAITEDYSELFNEAIKKIKNNKTKLLYHLSKDTLRMPLIPSIPKSKYEDQTTPRICFSDSIQGCLIGINENKNILGDIYHVYTLETNDYYVPTKDEVADVDITNEVWVLNKCTPKYVYDIKVIGISDVKNISINNNKYKINIWEYKVMDLDEKLNKIINESSEDQKQNIERDKSNVEKEQTDLEAIENRAARHKDSRLKRILVPAALAVATGAGTGALTAASSGGSVAAGAGIGAATGALGAVGTAAAKRDELNREADDDAASINTQKRHLANAEQTHKVTTELYNKQFDQEIEAELERLRRSFKDGRKLTYPATADGRARFEREQAAKIAGRRKEMEAKRFKESFEIIVPEDMIITESMSNEFIMSQLLDANGFEITKNNINVLAEAINNNSVVLVEARGYLKRTYLDPNGKKGISTKEDRRKAKDDPYRMQSLKHGRKASEKLARSEKYEAEVRNLTNNENNNSYELGDPQLIKDISSKIDKSEKFKNGAFDEVQEGIRAKRKATDNSN